MTFNGWLRILVVLGAVVAAAIPLGAYLARVLRGERIPLLSSALGPLERGLYRLMGVDARSDQNWMAYAGSKIGFSFVSMLILYVQLRLQRWLPLNPTHAPAMSPPLAFNTAVSFTTNTNWQAYSGETQASHLTQMLGLTFHNFTSAAAGIAVAAALIRGLTRRSTPGQAGSGLGNFWVDLTRVTLYVLLPISLVLALVFCALGMPQTLSGAIEAHTLEGTKQLLALGPIASQEVIKLLGTNGGGFFNANSAHPFENPTPLSNALEIFAILVIAAAMTEVFGRFAKDLRQGRVLLAAMLVLFLGGVAVTYAAETQPPPALLAAGADSSLGNMEGKEVRFGIADTALFAVATTGTSCGAVNAAMDSLTPLGGLIPLLNIQLGEIVFGGVGSGLYGMLIFALLAVFIAGLMVGRTPEYLGKKIEAKEMKMAMVVVLILATDILVGTSLAVSVPSAAKAALNGGPHGFTEILYAFSSATGNNGSAFAGLSADSPFYDYGLGVAMFVGRFLALIPVLAIAGSMARKTAAPPNAGTFPTTTPLFVGLLVGVILIVGALTFVPSLALGPIAESLVQSTGRLF